MFNLCKNGGLHGRKEILWDEKEKYLINKGKKSKEEYNMCQAMRELIEDGRMEGKIEGRSEGVLLASRIFKLLQANSSMKNEIIAQECDCSLKDVRVAFEI